MTLSAVAALILLILVLAVLIWGGDRLLALLPGNEKLKAAARIIAIVFVALWFLSMAASILGVSMPWNMGPTVRHR